MKNNDVSALIVTKVIGEYVDEFGRTHRKLTEELQTTPLNLGSVKHPKCENIIKIKYDVPRKVKKQVGGLDFSGLFG